MEKDIEFNGAEENYLKGNIYANQYENKTPIVLFMHGAGQTRHSWKGAAQSVAGNGIRTITLDARGHGESQWVDTQNYTMVDYTKDLVCVCGQIKQKFESLPIIVGASMGGMSAMLAMMETEVKLFSAVILVDVTPRPNPEGVARIQGFMKERIEDGFESVEEAAQCIAAFLPERPTPKSLEGLSRNLREKNGRYYWHWDPAFWSGRHPFNENHEKYMEAMWEGCRKMQFPILLVRGAKSELVSSEAVREFQRKVPNAEFVDVAHAGHMVAGDQNDAFIKELKQFILKHF